MSGHQSHVINSLHDFLKYNPEIFFHHIAFTYPRNCQEFVEEFQCFVQTSIRKEVSQQVQYDDHIVWLPNNEGKMSVGGFGIGVHDVTSPAIRVVYSVPIGCEQNLQSFLDGLHESTITVDFSSHTIFCSPAFGYELQFKFLCTDEKESRSNERDDAQLLPIQSTTEQNRFSLSELSDVLRKFGDHFWGLHHIGVGFKNTIESHAEISAFLRLIRLSTSDWHHNSGLFQFVADRAEGSQWFFLVPQVTHFPAIEFLCEEEGLHHIQIDVHVRTNSEIIRKHLKLDQGFAVLPPDYWDTLMTDVPVSHPTLVSHIVMVNHETNSPDWIEETMADGELVLVDAKSIC